MIEKHRECLRALSDEDVELVAEALRVTEPLLIEAVEARGMCQADVVMELLHYRDFLRVLWAGAAEAARTAALAPITGLLAHLARLHRTPVERPWPRPYPPHPPVLADPGQHWVAWVREGHIWLGPKGSRWSKDRVRTRLRVGQTVAQLEAAGVTRAELRAAEHAGKLRISSTPRGDAPRPEGVHP